METLLHARAGKQWARAPEPQRAELAEWGRRLAADPFLGAQVPKSRFPPLGVHLDNLWRLPLPQGWRALYTVVGLHKGRTQAVVLWMGTHKEYDRLLGYRTS